MDTKSLTLFLPCYNEEANLKKVIKDATDILPKIIDEFEILIIDDGSQDKTGEIADNLSSKKKEIRVVHHSKNMGYGAALRSGFKHSTKDLVFFTDGDGQFNLEEITKLLPHINRYEIVTGYRINRRDPLTRRINASLWNWLVNIIFRVRVRDINCAFKLFQRKIFNSLNLESDGAFINVELFARARRANYRIKEVGVNHYPRLKGKQTGADIKVITKAFRELILLWHSLTR